MADFKDGTYKGTAQGMDGDISVDVKISRNKIQKVEITKQHESKGISDPAIKQMPERITKNQSFNVGTVSGATVTSTGIKKAVQNALKNVKGYANEFSKQVEQKSQIKTGWNHTYDVVVVGSGGAGLSAAIAAKDAVSSVAVIEVMSSPFQSGTALSGGVFYAGGETSVQKKAGVKDSKKEWQKYLTAVGDGLDNKSISDTLVEEGGKDVDWLINLGVDFPPKSLYMSGSEATFYKQAKPAARGHMNAGTDGKGLIQPLYQKAKQLGVKFFFETKGKRLVKKGGKVIGIISDKGNFKANQGVILATAGFTRNKEMIKSFIPDFMNYISYGSPYQQGDGLRMGMALGAKISNMSIPVSQTPAMEVQNGLWACGTAGIFGSPCIFVDDDAKRHFAEDMYYEYQTPTISNQLGSHVWCIWDQNVADGDPTGISVPPASEGYK